MILLVTLTIGKFFTETCRSKSDGNLRREKMREFQKSFCGEFLQKSFLGKFWKVLQKVLQENFNGKKVLRGKWGTRFGLRLGKLLIRHSSS